MITVTRLKNVVNNSTIPILNEDGTVTSYYVTRYIALLEANGLTVSNDVIRLINIFINSGFDKGWLPYIKYLLPFIGSASEPKNVAIPLIDKVNNYNIYDYSPNWHFDDAIKTSNNKIVGFGNDKDYDTRKYSSGLIFPFTVSDKFNELSVFVGISDVYLNHYDNHSSDYIWGEKSDASSFELGMRLYNTSTTLNTVFFQAASDPQTKTLYMPRLQETLQANKNYYILQAIKDGQYHRIVADKDGILNHDTLGNYTLQPYQGEYNISTLGDWSSISNVKAPTLFTLNCLAIMDMSITNELMLEFVKDFEVLKTGIANL